ncbi:uncharacterized protein LOC121258730 [Juglans microcarpa x Juglans regia]|uniref:uncharacterized protein LOC121258730 n=1 Tax=Juglans microcarpa x Juglans regia TaxID=2249226 RepID=UPI001B7F4D7D|nr:uncharacterized protein LOC121258730 [Juglans microcarpa x Juglans regia]
MEGCLAINPLGRKGGLALFWEMKDDVVIKSYSQWHINAFVKGGGDGSWLFIGFYGHPDASKRWQLWELLKQLSPPEGGAWCVARDFNEVLSQNEKWEGNRREEKLISGFREALETNKLVDVGMSGNFFTWNNRHSDHTFTKERLNRYVVNKEWINLFGTVKVEGLTASTSDHHPIMLSVRKERRCFSQRQSSFKFEASWIREEECEGLIRTVWDVTSQAGREPLVCVLDMLRKCGSKLRGTFKRRDSERCNDIEQLNSRIKELQDREGPHNSTELHSLQKERRKKNQISSVVDAASKLKVRNEEVVEAFRQYYTELISKTLANRLKLVLDKIIAKNQSAFIPGTLILDNIIVAYETLHSMKTRSKGKGGSMALKMDISKAYDRVEWNFLKAVMQRMGFRPGDVIYPSRGIRQGDPISPYLFLLCAEGLSSLINAAEAKGETRGMAVARGSIRVSHLLFADDCIIFARAKWHKWMKVKEILRAKYYKNYDVLSSNLGYGPSMIWRSIWGSLKLLKEGLVWRVDNGLSIKVWGDKWLPSKPSHRVQSPIKHLNDEAKVAELIGNGGRWDVETVKATFTKEEAEVICNIPLSYTGLEDKRIWAYSKNGCFSVRSVYHLDLNRKKDWKWESSDNLYRRKVVEKPICPICLREDETVCHALWSYPAAMDVWAEKESPVQKWKSSEMDLVAVWKKLLAELPLEMVELVQAKSSLNEFQQAQQKGVERAEIAAVGRRLVKWEASGNGFVKVNWDAAFKADQRRMGAGVVIRDKEGNVQVSLCLPIDYVQSVVVVEVAALWRALCLCVELNIHKAIFEGDSLEVIKAVNNREECLEWHGQIIEDITKIFCMHPNWILKHT